jgi:hypothetical protein
MTLDLEHDAQDQAVREALEDLRRVIRVIAHEGGGEREKYVLGYVDSVDHLLRVFVEDRPAFYRHANSGILWHNMGSIEDLSDRRIWESLVRLADAMNIVGLANRATLDDANRLRDWLARDGA